MLGRIIIGAFVEELGAVLEAEEAMGEAGRDPEQLPDLGGQLETEPLAEMGRGAPNVDDDVEGTTGDNADELTLGLLELVMEAAQHAAGRTAVIVLDEDGVNAGGGIVASAPGFEEEAAIVAEDLRFDQLEVGMRGVDQPHQPRSIRNTFSRYSP